MPAGFMTSKKNQKVLRKTLVIPTEAKPIRGSQFFQPLRGAVIEAISALNF